MNIYQTSNLNSLLNRTYYFSSIVIFFSFNFLLLIILKHQTNIFLCFLHSCYRRQFLDIGKILLFDKYLFRVLLFHFTSSEVYLSEFSWVHLFFSGTLELYISFYFDSISESFTNPNFSTWQRWYHTYVTQRSQRSQDTEKSSACQCTKTSLPWLEKEFLIRWVTLKFGMLILPSQETQDMNLHSFPAEVQIYRLRRSPNHCSPFSIGKSPFHWCVCVLYFSLMILYP